MSVTTQELLKKAAVVAGINYHHIDNSGVWWSPSHIDDRVYCWNPLKSQFENDALAAQFGIKAQFEEGLDQAIAFDLEDRAFRVYGSECEHNKEEAVRRAVVLAVIHEDKVHA